MVRFWPALRQQPVYNRDTASVLGLAPETVHAGSNQPLSITPRISHSRSQSDKTVADGCVVHRVDSLDGRDTVKTHSPATYSSLTEVVRWSPQPWVVDGHDR